MSNYKVKVNNEAESREVQGLFFKLGFAWLNTEKIYRDIGKNTHISSFKYSNVMDLGMGNGAINHKELTIQQLRDLVVLKRNSIDDATHEDYQRNVWFVSGNDKYMMQDSVWELRGDAPLLLKPLTYLKEYLVPQGNGKYTLTKATEKRVSDWVEIAEPWMDFVYQMPDGEFRYSDVLDEFKAEFIVWQRHTQPEELPFVDDANPIEFKGYNQWIGGHKLTDDKSLNDTYAEIEQVGQTLNERQSTYGDFKCVANTTGQLMAVILNSKNGQTLPYAHEEALHMICSKIARIMNGDMNHKDSWHDIAGYATLIDESL